MTNVRGLVVAFVVALLAPLSAFAQDASGEAIYKRRCAACHERPADGRTPAVETLQNMPSSRILRTLDFGAMMTIAYQLNRAEREAVARFLGKPGGDPVPRAEAFCSDRSVSIDTSASPIWNGWSPSPNNSRFAPAALAEAHRRSGLEAEIEVGVRVRGRHLGLLAADRDRQSGLHWQRRRRGARAARRHGLPAVDVSGCRIDPIGDRGRADGRPERPALWRSHRVVLRARSATGKEIWRKRPEEHEAVRLSAPPVVVDGVAYIGASSWEESRALNPEYPAARSAAASRLCACAMAASCGRRTRFPRRRTHGKDHQGVETLGPPASESGPRRRSTSSAAGSMSRPATTTRRRPRRPVMG